jgi:phosphopantothenoylcysteine decarboxylase/phosphopantothenate--cysteine ligase
MTPSAKDFITPLTLSTLSKNPVICSSFNQEDGHWQSHVELGTWADLMIIAPLTANTLAKMVHGIADNFVTTAYLSARCPIFFAPAMDFDMYHHPSTVENVRKLQLLGHLLIEPQVGELASGLSGPGRMEEPEKIVNVIDAYFRNSQDLVNKKILITAGPTYEAIDPVRFIGNHSSGQMGFELAHESARRGAQVILITGPTHMLIDHPSVDRVDVLTAKNMYAACSKYFPDSDITIMAAAVADFSPDHYERNKIKKEKGELIIKLKATKDILHELGKKKSKDKILVGFALETDNGINAALQKLQDKNLDLIVLNSLKNKGAGFGTSTNKITIITHIGKQINYPLKPKNEVAKDIIDQIVKLVSNHKAGAK